MSHGRQDSFGMSSTPGTRAWLCALLSCSVLLAGGCGADETDVESGTAEDGRTWSVDSQQSQHSADTGTDEASHDSAEADDSSNASSDVASADTTSSSDPDWNTVRCESGQATEAAFEGSTRNPATRVTVFVRDDCVLVGSIATSTYDGNFNLTIRGELDASGGILMAGRTSEHHAELTGTMGSATADVRVRASFDGTQIERDMTLARIE